MEEVYEKITVEIRKDILPKFRKRLEEIGMGESWFVGMVMEDYVKGHFRIIDGEVEDIRKIL